MIAKGMIAISTNKIYGEGQMLRIERLRQGKELKEVANRICSVSTLSKIERGKQKIDLQMLVDLYKELGITYENDETFIDNMKFNINQYYYETIYQFENESLKVLKVEDLRLNYSPLAIEWMIIKALENDESVLSILDSCVEFMDGDLLGWYYLIPRHEDNDIILEKRIKAQRILQNSLATLSLMWTYWAIGEYNMVTKLSTMAINFALDEGNTWALSQVYLMLGGIYSCYNMEELMIGEYQKAINLLKNTHWKEALDTMYYNIGATYISLGNYEKAREYLNICKIDEDNFSLYHKWAVLEIKIGNLVEANKWIEKMERFIEHYKDKYECIKSWDKFKKSHYNEFIQILEVTQFEAVGNPEQSSTYIRLLESLMDKFLKEGRYGFMNFHKDSLANSYIINRRYKDALELEKLFSQIKTKHMINI